MKKGPSFLSSVVSRISWIVAHLLLYGFFKGKSEDVVKTPVLPSVGTGSDLNDSPEDSRGSGGGGL